MKETKLRHGLAIQAYVEKKVYSHVTTHYSEYEDFLWNNGHTIYISETIQCEYSYTLEQLIENEELEDLNSPNRDMFLYGPDSINTRIIEMIDSAIEEENKEEDLPF